MPGVEVGDIGPKMEWYIKDNGYLAFNNFWIPWENMLMKYASLDKNGVFKNIGDPKILYSVMLATWIWILHGTGFHLSIGLTTAIWYAHVWT